MSIDLNR